MEHTIARRTPVLCTFAILAALGPDPAAAQAPAGCTGEITSLPYTVTSNGNYCLKNTMFTALLSGAAITVHSSVITAVIDLRGFAINNLAGGSSSTATAIEALDKSNLVVRNGRIQSFRYGITLGTTGGSEPYGNVVENIHIDSARYAGIQVFGRGHQVRGCTVTRFGQPGSSPAVGIYVVGENNLVEDNVVAESLAANGRGIWALGVRHQIVGNRVLNPQGKGIDLDGASSAVYRDNQVTGAQVPYLGGIDNGNNQ